MGTEEEEEESLFLSEREDEHDDKSVPNFANRDSDFEMKDADVKEIVTMSDDEDDEDPIIQQIPIYLTNELGNKVNIFQFTSRSSDHPLRERDGSAVTGARLKPKVGIVEVDIPIDTTRFYDREKENQWGSVRAQTFGGPVRSPIGSNNTIGVFRDGELHLTKVSNIGQLRPQFKYFVKETSKAEPTVQREARTIQMTAKSSSDLAPKFSGALTARRMADEEEYVSLYWYDRDSTEASTFSEKLLASNKEKLISKTGSEEFKKELQR